MTEDDIRQWMLEHPRSIHESPNTFIQRCNLHTRRRGSRAAWAQAKEIVDRERHHWEGDHGNHASPGFVAREICNQIAVKLRGTEPDFEGCDECRSLDSDIARTVEPDAMEELRPWLHEMAAKVEREEWLRVIEFTKQRARTIAEEEHLSSDTHWESTWEYGEAAALATEILSRDFARHLH